MITLDTLEHVSGQQHEQGLPLARQTESSSGLPISNPIPLFGSGVIYPAALGQFRSMCQNGTLHLVPFGPASIFLAHETCPVRVSPTFSEGLPALANPLPSVLKGLEFLSLVNQNKKNHSALKVYWQGSGLRLGPGSLVPSIMLPSIKKLWEARVIHLAF